MEEETPRPAGDWIFVSDAHLTGRDRAEMEVFLSFLEAERGRMGHLVLLGDLFEFFFRFGPGRGEGGERDLPFQEYLPVLRGLERLSREGVRITYVEGNHDFGLDGLFQEQFGMEVSVYPEAAEERLGGRRTFLAHGDFPNPGPWSQRAFRRVLRNGWTYGLMRILGERISRWVARRLNDRSYLRNHAGAGDAAPPAFRGFARRKFLEGYDVVILGHSHVPERVTEDVEGRSCLYVNTGAWMNDRSYMRFTAPDRFELARFERELKIEK
jgi:UDP-2,3-diacylglucosamine hydrolase